MKTRKMKNNGQLIWLALLAALILCLLSDMLYTTVDESDPTTRSNYSICEGRIV